MEQPYEPPEFEKTGFNCPHCSAYANHEWYRVNLQVEVKANHWSGAGAAQETRLARCMRCRALSIWHTKAMIYPIASLAPLPSGALPNSARTDYEEAREILARSPRGAAALLRLSVQKLCKVLGEPGKNINDDIGSLVKKGLPPKIRESLDIVRVVGNNAVHPGQMDIEDDEETALSLFHLVNFIADVMIAQPKKIDSLYQSLPPSSREAITKRDGGT